MYRGRGRNKYGKGKKYYQKKSLSSSGNIRSYGGYGKFQMNKMIGDVSTKELKFHHRSGIDSISGCANANSEEWLKPGQTSTGVAGDQYTLVNIPIGNAGFQREGRKIIVKSLKFKGIISGPNNASPNDNISTSFGNIPTDNNSWCIRLIIFKDKQTNTTGTTDYDELIDNLPMTHGSPAAAAGRLTHARVFGYRNLYNTERYEFLCDDLYTTTVTAMGAPVGSWPYCYSPIKIEKEFKLNTPIIYNDTGAGGDIAQIKSNNFQFAIIGSWSNTDKFMNIQWSSEIRYYDD